MINISISNLNNMLYTSMVLLSIMGGLLIAFILMRRLGINRNIAIISLGINFSLILLGAVLYTMISSYISSGHVTVGLSSLGAMLGILLGSLLTVKIAEEDGDKVFKSYVFALPFMYSVGKIGCTSVGCCGGFKYDGLMAFHYHGDASYLHDYPVFPVQFLEVIVFAFIFVICIKNIKKYSISKVIFLCAFFKFALDFFREEHFQGILLSNNQVVCIILILAVVLKKIASKNVVA